MKKSIIYLSLVIFASTLCSFQPHPQVVAEILQEALNMEELDHHFVKNEAGDFLPLTIISNQLISKKLDLNYKGTRVAIYKDKEQLGIKNNSILELTELKLKGNKSIFFFKYGEKNIKIRLKKMDGIWVSKAITVKWKNGFTTQIVSHF